MWLKGARSQGGGQCWEGRGITGKKASFVDDTEHCFATDKNYLEEIFTHILFFPPLLNFLNIKNTDPQKRRKEEKNMEEHESHSSKEKIRAENSVN